MKKLTDPKMTLLMMALFGMLGLGWIVFRIVHPKPKVEIAHSSSHSPLFEPGDRPTTVFLKEVEAENGKIFNSGVVIRQSKIRANQMKQALLAYLQGPRTGRAQVPVPEGMGLNEFYFTPNGVAVIDLSVSAVDKEKVGFYEEALFIRGLIEALTNNFFEVKQVKVLVDGQDGPTLLGHYALGTSEASAPVSASNGPLN